MNRRFKKAFAIIPAIIVLAACGKNSPIGLGGPTPVTPPSAVVEDAYAFPGAEGFGRNATGGRGGTVIEVTNLNDNGTGSLRAAINASGPRIIVFKVSGRIILQSTLSIKNGNITIAGQTAPGDGICVSNNTMTVDADNVIIRYMRFRLGDEAKVENDALNGRNHQNIIIDHCSLSWSVDEAGSFYDNKNFTLQWCILSESLYASVHDKGNHGYGGIWGGQGVSFHHNLLSDHTNRNPRFNGSRYSKQPDLEIVDFRNNVIYNWVNSVYGGEGGNANMVNNYYKAGPATTSSTAKYRILQYTGWYYDATVRPDTLYGGKFYIAGNYVAGYPNVTADNWTLGVQRDANATAAQVAAARQNTAFAFAPVLTQTAEEAYQSVLDSAGATLPKRDAVDTRIISEARSGIETFGGSYGAAKGIIDTQSIFGAWPTYNSATAAVDTDKDGMPDAWETSKGLNPNDASDANKRTLSSAYDNVEVYINSIGK